MCVVIDKEDSETVRVSLKQDGEDVDIYANGKRILSIRPFGVQIFFRE